MVDVRSQILQLLDKRKTSGTYRTLPKSNHLCDFTSNDFLGLSRSEKLKELAVQAFTKSGLPLGATGSRLLSGNHEWLEEAERQIARFHKAEAGLIFSSGYLANIGLISSLPQKGDTIFYDQLCHASIKYGIRLSHARAYSFKHNDVDDLKRKARLGEGHVYVITESLFSMDGDMAPLPELAVFCKNHHFNLIVDEAHTTGLYGPKGEGLVCGLGLEEDVFARLHTFGKALGLQGAIIVGPEILREYLINYCPSFIYSTAMAPPMTVCVQTAYHLLPEMEKERTCVFALHQKLKRELNGNSRFKFQGSGPVNCLIIPGNENAREASSFLAAKGFDVKPILSPTVPVGQERIRICLHAFNTAEEVDTLVAGIKEFEKTIQWKESLSQE